MKRILCLVPLLLTLACLGPVVPIALVTGIALTSGCANRQNLDPAGVYKGDVVLYNADKTIKQGYDVMHAFVKWEYENREALKGTPEVKNAANTVRASAKDAIQSTVRLRDAYARSPIDANRTALTAALDTLEQAILEAQKYLAPKK